MRDDFNRALSDVVKLHDNNSVFRLKKIWDSEDTNFYLRDANRFTNEGLNAYWAGVDKTIQFCDNTLLKKLQKHHITGQADPKQPSTTAINRRIAGFNIDRFQWRADKSSLRTHPNPHHHAKKTGFRLPSPPASRQR